MATFRSVLRQAFHISGGQRVRIVAQRTALRARSGAFRNEIGVRMHADPTDIRGVLLAMYHGNLDRSAVATWRRLAEELRPTVALDIGANYGEVAFSTRYHQRLRQLHLVEPNPAVLHRLRETVRHSGADYPDIVLHEGAASDESGTARLNFHTHSGVSSLRLPSDRGVSVDCFRLDERITLDPDDSLLFKIDVEGHELAALEGMAGLLRGRQVAGICEVMHADDELLEFLCDHFAVTIIRAGVEHPVDLDGLRDTIAQARATGWAGLSKDVVLRSR
ncbi:FkbM family methyltransferase [Micromonospora sp. NBC_01796]|uniref:FkbM family methyltransferase n=1 Tax=Micromonospora sp. NBC_01796 TaxID=2975987 RepID=UPI002DDA51D1|nr:FkbM family methyltransferase [Micromonospora sp. NBC_01796]WSA82771.1 FkbM family methyltransferase [Micromonospora sp. NBC_01796]